MLILSSDEQKEHIRDRAERVFAKLKSLPVKALLRVITAIENLFQKKIFSNNFLSMFRIMKRRQPILIELLSFARTNPFMSMIFGCVSATLLLLFLFLTFVNASGDRKQNMHFVSKVGGGWTLARNLQKADFISSALLFRIAIGLTFGSRLWAGEYIIKADDSYADIIHTMQKGRSVRYKFTVPEGKTNHQIREALRINTMFDGEIGKMPEEGTLLPETYFVYWGKKRSSIIRQMHLEHNRVVKKLWAQRTNNLLLNNIKEAVILASIVEKETGLEKERKHIAGVFLNRLNKASYMQLQSDPTVIYAITKGKMLDRPLTYEDLRQDHPYNTYVNYGLPPGAIANPGFASLKAVMNPQATKDFYFVADGSGGHAFAETYEAHLENVKKWRKVQNGDALEEH